jgi:ATP:ADP antiporter, AAA family
MTTEAPAGAGSRPGPIDRLLGLFSDVRPGEGSRALLMLANIFLILVCYYVIKTVREPLILDTEVPDFLQHLGIRGPAEVKTYAAAAQALILMAFVPAYSWFASRVDRMKLIYGVTLFFAANSLAFAVLVDTGVALIGVLFYVWVGFFSLSIIAQFWSYANDIYTKEAGNRIFPIIAIGMTAGTPVGAWLAERMFSLGIQVHVMLYLAAGILLTTLAVYTIVNRGTGDPATKEESAEAEAPLGHRSGFALVFASRYIMMIAGLMILLNLVNTTGEYILSRLVVSHADAALAADPGFDTSAYIGAFYGNYFFWVNVVAVVFQAFLVSRLVKYLGLAGVLFALPLTSFAAYGFIALGVTSLGLVRWLKTAENSTDYSVMNTARQLLWLPTTREEKYKAKQAVDSFFVRLGDLVSAVVVFVGTTWLALEAQGFALLNVGVVVVWLVLAVVLVRENRRLSSKVEAPRAA